MRTVMLMRHAKSDWAYPELDDHDRPLNKRGKRNAPKMARFLKEQGLIPDLIVTSSATRALRTAQAVGEVCGCDSLKVDSDLYHATPEDWHDVLNQLPPVSTLLGVGHNPGLEDLLLEITGEYFRMKTGTVACLEFADTGDSWDSEWTGSCVTYSPKELKE